MARIRLRHDREWDRFVLANHSINHQSASFEMVIDYTCVGECRYRFIAWTEGEWIELLRPDEYKQRVQDIVEHEGLEMAALWEQHQVGYQIIAANHPVFTLQRRWEAMLELGLFEIPISLRSWEGHPIPAEGQRQMTALQEQQMRDAAADMRAELEGPQ